MKFWPSLFALPFASAVLFTDTVALASCTDVAAPGVYWRRCVMDRQDLREADLTGATLRESSFKRADLADALLNEVDARRVKLVTTNLQGAQLNGASLVRADLTKANLKGASLKDADLTLARVFQADFSEADLTGARLEGTDLLQAIFDGATWIDGKTICAEGSVGRCQRATPPSPDTTSDAEPSG